VKVKVKMSHGEQRNAPWVISIEHRNQELSAGWGSLDFLEINND